MSYGPFDQTTAFTPSGNPHSGFGNQHHGLEQPVVPAKAGTSAFGSETPPDAGATLVVALGVEHVDPIGNTTPATKWGKMSGNGRKTKNYPAPPGTEPGVRAFPPTLNPSRNTERRGNPCSCPGHGKCRPHRQHRPSYKMGENERKWQEKQKIISEYSCPFVDKNIRRQSHDPVPDQKPRPGPATQVR